MAARSSVLNDSVLDFLAARLVLADSDAGARPVWPVSDECLTLLREGHVAEALELPDNPNGRYLVLSTLGPHCRHLLRARDVELGREVVIKLIRAPSKLARVAAAHEARLLARMRHPNVLTVHEVDSARACLVLERLDGDLRDYQGLDRDLLLDALCQAGRGLASVHGLGLCHGDFKLENVLVQVDRDGSGRITGLHGKLGDFGEARSVGPCADWLVGDAPTPSVALAQRQLDDQRSFAVAVWEVLAGQFPPGAASLIDPNLRAVLSRALMADATQRWADMTALVDAIERGRAGAAATSSLLDSARVQAREGHYATIQELWEAAELAMLGEHLTLGRSGFKIGMTVLRAAASRRRGRAGGVMVAVGVLIPAAKHLRIARRHEDADEALRVAAMACERLAESRVLGFRRRRELRQIADQIRVLSLIHPRMPETKEAPR